MTRHSSSCLSRSLLVLLLASQPVWSGKFKCPAYTKLAEKDFHFPDPDQCDKYWTCQNGNSRRSLCPDGLVFHPDKEDGEDPCDLRHNVPDKCEGREDLQRPKPGDAHCPRQNGVYASSIPGECDTYYSCLNGKSSPTKCAPGLHYSDEIGTCVWPRESGRDDCDAAPTGGKRRTTAAPVQGQQTTSKAVETLSNGFRCPGGKLGLHPALPHPTDCRLYYVCLDGITATDAGCVSGKVFNPSTKQCDIPANVAGCEYYYNPKLKKQKEEEKKQIASELGTDVSNSDFSQFLKLLKMSGVLGGDAGEALRQSPALSFPNKNLRNRKRPGGLGGRRKKPARRRPTTPAPVYDYYYDYDYADYYDYEEPQAPAAKFPPRTQQRGRVNILAKQDDLKNDNRATPIKSTRQEDTEESQTKSAPALPQSSAGKSLFAVPDSRRFSARFIPRVKPVAGANLDNIHPAGFLKAGETVSSARAPSVTKPSAPVPSSPPPPPRVTESPPAVKSEPQMSLSGKEADDLFNSLFPGLGDAGDAVASSRPARPLPQVTTSPAPVPVTREQSTVRQETAPQPELPRSPLFNRPRSKLRFRPKRPVISVTSTTEKVDQLDNVVTESGSDDNKEGVNEERASLFSMRKRFRSKNSLLRKIAKETQTEEAVTTSGPRVEPSSRRNNRFSFVPTPVPVSSAAPGEGGDIRDNIIESSSINEIPNSTPRSFKKFLPRKSFRALIQSKNRNQFSTFRAKQAKSAETTTTSTTVSTTLSTTTTTTVTTTVTSTVTTTTAPPPTTTTVTTTTPSTTRLLTTTTTQSSFPLNLIPTRSNNPFTFFQSLVSTSAESESVQAQPRGPLTTATTPPTAPTTQSFVPTRSPNVTPFTFFQSPFNSVFSQQPSPSRSLPPVEPAFLNIPAVNTPAPAPASPPALAAATRQQPQPSPFSSPQLSTFSAPQPIPFSQTNTFSAPQPDTFSAPQPQPQPDPFSTFRARGQVTGSASSQVRAPVSQVSQVPVTQASPVQRISFGRGPAPTSLVSLETEDPEHRRMMTQRARVQIKNFLPKAENEGDAIEKLRAKIESFQNRNRARG